MTCHLRDQTPFLCLQIYELTWRKFDFQGVEIKNQIEIMLRYKYHYLSFIDRDREFLCSCAFDY